MQVRGKPSASASKEMNSQEKARLTLQQSSLGEEALRRKEEELEEAMEKNEVLCRDVILSSPLSPLTPTPTVDPSSHRTHQQFSCAGPIAD